LTWGAQIPPSLHEQGIDNTDRHDQRILAVEQRVSGELLKVSWQERGGPLTTTPRRKGFGTTLISTVFSDASLDYAPDGLSCQFSLKIAPPFGEPVGEARLPGL